MKHLHKINSDLSRSRNLVFRYALILECFYLVTEDTKLQKRETSTEYKLPLRITNSCTCLTWPGLFGKAYVF